MIRDFWWIKDDGEPIFLNCAPEKKARAATVTFRQLAASFWSESWEEAPTWNVNWFQKHVTI